MHSGRRELHWDTPIYGSTQRAHFDPRTGDNYSSIIKTRKGKITKDLIYAMDNNYQNFFGHNWSMHWSEAGPNGYTEWVGNDGRVHKMTKQQLHWSPDKWGEDGFRSWQRPNGERLRTYNQMVSFAVKNEVVLTPELKSRNYADRQVMQSMVKIAQRHDHPAWYMALLAMAACREKNNATWWADGQFAVIFGRFRKLARHRPADWAEWDPKPMIWGPAKWWLN